MIYVTMFCLCPLLYGVLDLSLYYFEFIFLYGVRECSNLIDVNATVPTFTAPLAEETVFSPLCILASFIKD